MSHRLISIFYINEASLGCTVASVSVSECVLTNTHMGPSFSIPDVEMLLVLASPICVPSSRESTCISASMGGCDERSTAALQKLLRPSLVLPESDF